MPRKTVDVASVVSIANRVLAAEGSTPEERRAVAHMVEQVLHGTGNYRGFRYLASEYAAEGEPWAEGTTYLRVGFDNTRREYI